jgi:hypothetical protein
MKLANNEPPKSTVNMKGLVAQTIRSFSKFEEGVIEGLKNSSDIYADLEIEKKDKRDIIVFIQKNTRQQEKVSFAILDFGGMTESALQHYFDWMNPRTDSKKGSTNGHGNGGKVFLIKFFKNHSVASFLDGAANKFSINGMNYNDESMVGNPNWHIWQNGIYENGRIKKNSKQFDYSMTEFLDSQIKEFGFDCKKLRKEFPWVNDMFETRNGFTIIGGEAMPKYAKQLTDQKKFFDVVTNHHQANTALKDNDITIIINKRHYKHNGQRFLEIPNIPPYEGFEKKRIIQIPKFVSKVDEPDVKIETYAKDDSYLIMSTSKSTMNTTLYSTRHTVVFKYEKSNNSEENFGYIDMDKLVPNHRFANHIYGELHLGSLAAYKGNARQELVPSSLKTAMDAWMRNEFVKYLDEIFEVERKQMEEKEMSDYEKLRNELQKDLSKAMNMKDGVGSNTGKTSTDDIDPLPPHKLNLYLAHNYTALGVQINLAVIAVDENNKPVTCPKYKVLLENDNFELIRKTNGIIAVKPGITKVRVVSDDSKNYQLRSNQIKIEAINIKEIKIDPATIKAPDNSFVEIKFQVYKTRGGDPIHSDCFLNWSTPDNHIARVNEKGHVYGKLKNKTANIYAQAMSVQSNVATVNVVEGKEKQNKNNAAGINFLIMGKDFDLVHKVHSSQDPEKTLIPGPEKPEMIQRPDDIVNKTYWINPLAYSFEVIKNKYQGTKTNYINSPEYKILNTEIYIMAGVNEEMRQNNEEKIETSKLMSKMQRAKMDLVNKLNKVNPKFLSNMIK